MLDPNIAEETDRQVARYTRRSRSYDLEARLFYLLLGQKLRRKLFEGCRGRLLEVGVGTGINFDQYPEQVEAHAIDLTPAMLEIARQQADKAGLNVQLKQMDVCALDFPDSYFDRIVASCVFCSVPDAVGGFRELRRVVKPDGEIRLLEHMRPDLPVLGPLFDKLDGSFYRRFGFHIARRTLDNIAAARLRVTTDEVRLSRIFHYLEVVRED